MADLNTRLLDLPPEKLRQLRQRIQQRKAQPEPAPELPRLRPTPEQRFEPFPLTDVQEAYWVGRSDLFELGNVSSHGYSEWPMEELSVRELERALNQLIERHEMLRAVISADGTQRILERPPRYEIEVQDLRRRPPEEASAALAATREEMSHQVIPADRWPLFDLRVSLLDGARAVVHLSFDILIGDLWSFRILMQELHQLYQDPAARPPAIDMSFRDYVLALHDFRSTPAHQRAEEYWREHLPQLPPAPQLPVLTQRLDQLQPRFVRRAGHLPKARWQRLRQLARQQGLTPSGLVLAAYALVVAQWSKSQQLSLNITTFNRLPLHPHVDRVIGDFTSLTLLPVDWSESGSFAEQAKAIQRRLWRNLEHPSVSGVQLMRRIAQREGRLPGPVMPVVFTSLLLGDEGSEGDSEGLGDSAAENLQAGVEEETAPGSDFYSISQTPQVWLDHQVTETDGALVFNWDAVDALFPPQFLDSMFDAYCRLLERLQHEEAWELADHSWLLGEQLVRRREVNATEAPVPGGLLHQRFEEQAAREPSRVAVVSGGREITYGELDRRSARLAVRLQELGARPNALVAVVMEKGWEEVVAVLAVLRSGAAYLPVDASWPEHRRDRILELGEVEIAVTQPRLDRDLGWPRRVLRLVVEAEEAETEPPPVPEAVQAPEDLAYVIFTSGSTGEPKGVMIDHRGALNTVVDVNQRFEVGPEDRVLALSRLSFDLSVYDIFGILATGAALVMPEPAAHRDPERWHQLMVEQRVTLWNSVPALLEMLVHFLAGRPGVSLPALRGVMLSGDWIPVSLPDRLRALAPEARVVSMGGATEASIWSILYPIDEVPGDWPSIPYGRAMVNQTFHVLNQRLEPCPEWVPGELYIGGIGVAKGYWKDPERTAASFFDHPRTGERLYHTGDLGRFLPTGDIEFLGREDFQVKVGGHRIELGEIDVTLGQHPRVEACVSHIAGDPKGERSLVAYVVLTEDETPSSAAMPAAPEPRELTLQAVELRDREPWSPEFVTGSAAQALALLAPPAGAAATAEGVSDDLPSPTLAFENLGRWLSALRLEKPPSAPLVRGLYASAGDLYPVQTYLAVPEGAGGVERLPAGLYYLHPREGALVQLSAETPFRDTLSREAASEGAPEASSCTLLMVGKVDAVTPMYGPLAHSFCQLEAGYTVQLLNTLAPRYGLALSPGRGVEALASEAKERLDRPGLLPLMALRVETGRADSGTRDLRRAVLAADAPEVDTDEAAELVTELVTDPAQRLDHKLSEPGLRRDLDGWPRFQLPSTQLEDDLQQVLETRRSHRSFASEALPGDAAAELLRALLEQPLDGVDGCLHPRLTEDEALQVYLHLRPGCVAPEAESAAALAPGVYRLFPGEGRLEPVSESAGDLPVEAHVEVNREIYEQAALSIFFVAAPGTSIPAARAAAGAQAQLLMTTAAGAGIGLCPVGEVSGEAVAELLGLDSSARAGSARLVHSLVGGGLVPDADASHGHRPTAELREFLGEHLPSYMVPGHFIYLDALPLTANGKVDRRALPEPEVEQRAAVVDDLPPEGELEETIAGLLRDLLGIASVGRDASFFDLGGNSVQMIQFYRRLTPLVEGELRVMDLFHHPTVRSLAAHLSSQDEEAAPLGEERKEQRQEGRDRLKQRLRRRRRGQDEES